MKNLKRLKTKKGRDELNQFIVEGEKTVNEIPEDWKIAYFVCAERYAPSLSRYQRRAEVKILRDSLFDAVCDTKTPQGVLAVCEQKHFSMGEVIKPRSFLLMGERLSDPGNIGTLIRTAAAAGADGIILSEGSAEVYNPKVLRAAAGAALRVPFVTGVTLTESAQMMKENHIRVIAAYPHGGNLPYETDLRGGVCILVGNEARGLSETAAGLADEKVRLPMPGGTESLNASVAGGILLYEAVRQRLMMPAK